MRACSDCRRPPIPGRTFSPRMSTWTSRRPRDAARMALFAAMAVIWGIPYLLIKIAVGQLTPASLVFVRTAIGAALLLPVAAARGWLTPLLPYWRWALVYTSVEGSPAWVLLADREGPLLP